jgi:hypothetical protein
LEQLSADDFRRFISTKRLDTTADTVPISTCRKAAFGEGAIEPDAAE